MREPQLLQESDLIVHARTLKSQRESTSSKIDSGMLDRYEKLRKKMGGVAVAEVVLAPGCGPGYTGSSPVGHHVVAS